MKTQILLYIVHYTPWELFYVILVLMKYIAYYSITTFDLFILKKLFFNEFLIIETL